MFTRQHYKAIAEIVWAEKCRELQGGAANLSVLTHKLANYFAKDNKQFDRKKFLEACGLCE